MLKRSLLYVIVIATMILSACAAPTAAPTSAPAQENPTEAPMAAEPTQAPAAEEQPAAAPTEASAAPAAYTEAPMLTEMVKAGTLPPLEERLPADVFVVGPGSYMTEENLPDWQPGVYGGTLRGAHSVANWAPDMFVAVNEPLLQAAKIGDQNIVGSVVKDYEVSPDNTTFTFHMRKGLKWSDGEPVTTEDVRFAWDDIKGNEQITPIWPAAFKTGYSTTGNPGKLDIVDDFTFTITFDGPYGAFLRYLTIEGWRGYTDLIEPAHYLKQYHIKYTTLDALKPELDALNLTDEWWQVFAAKRCQNWDMSNPRCADYPGLYPWIITKTDNPSLLVWNRNPYYFKVDTKGQQLPYIDKLISQQVDNVEMVNLKVLTGEVDFLRESTALVKIPLYKENEDKAGFRVALTEMHVDSSGLRLNETFDDPDWQTLSQDIRFRKAVSMSINRQELIDTIYYGYASVPSETVSPEDATYNVDAANALLDEIGLTAKDADGYRLYPSGKALDILLEQGAQAPDIAPISDLVAQYLKDVGIKVTVKQIDSTLWSTKWAANEIQATVMWSHDMGWSNDITSGNVDRAGRLWAVWHDSLGKEGVEPPAWAAKAYDIDTAKWAAVAGSDEYNAKVQEGLAWDRDNLPYINFVEHVKYPLIVNKNLKNVPVAGYAIGANFSIVQMFFAQ